MVIKALILAYYKQSVKTIMKIDSSDYVSNRVFSLLSNNELIHSIAFFSKNLISDEYNYKTHEKKLLTIIRYFVQ